MSSRHLPVRPNLDQLKHQAKDLLRQIRQGDPVAIEELTNHHPKRVDPSSAPRIGDEASEDIGIDAVEGIAEPDALRCLKWLLDWRCRGTREQPA